MVATIKHNVMSLLGELAPFLDKEKRMLSGILELTNVQFDCILSHWDYFFNLRCPFLIPWAHFLINTSSSSLQWNCSLLLGGHVIHAIISSPQKSAQFSFFFERKHWWRAGQIWSKRCLFKNRIVLVLRNREQWHIHSLLLPFFWWQYCSKLCLTDSVQLLINYF